MKRIVWVYGLIAGGVLAGAMFATLPFQDLGDRGVLIGYTTMVLAFLLVYFGVRSYRDDVAGGSVSFGRALVVGALIMLIASVCYTAAWEVIYFRIEPDFGAKYAARAIAQAKASGLTGAALDARVAEMRRFAVLYQNVAYNAAVTFLEPLPVGVLAVLISAGLLRRRASAPAFPPADLAGALSGDGR